MSLRELYKNHLQVLQSETTKALAELQLDGLLLGAGEPRWYFEDDQNPPYRANHHFRHWCPMEGSHHLLLVRPGQKPLLRLYQPADFWHEIETYEADFWGEEFQVEICSDDVQLWRDLSVGKRIAYHGPDQTKAATFGLEVNVPGLLPRLNWQRLFKTPYEVHCLVEATKKAADGHKAAERCFRQGGSELDIHYAYLKAVRGLDQDLPYENIIAINEKAAFLHYSAKRDEVHNGKVLLIDAGAACRGYAADITRTYATEDAPEEFRALLEDLIAMQAQIVAGVHPGILMADLHYLTHKLLAELLLKHRLIFDGDAESAIERGFTQAFFPHGLGHMLGVFVHDVAGKQIDPSGTLGLQDPRFPKLRTIRPLQAGTIVTIEPGLYFIKLLLDPIRAGIHSKSLNWALIDRLMPCGGIRIEDNIHVSDEGVRNVTREFLP